MEFLFELDRAVKAIETRVPYGSTIVRVLLSAGVLYATLFALRALFTDFVWPTVQLVDASISFLGDHHDIPVGLSRGLGTALLSWAVAISLLAIFTYAVRYILARIGDQIRRLETVLEGYQSIFWKPLGKSEQKRLADELGLLGRHRVLISTVERTDCVELARDLRECFESARWQISPGAPLLLGNGTSAHGGLLLWLKKGADDFNKAVFDALVRATSGPVSSLTHESSDSPDVQIVLRPKRMAVD